jgi:hypothetical protein
MEYHNRELSCVHIHWYRGVLVLYKRGYEVYTNITKLDGQYDDQYSQARVESPVNIYYPV